MVDSIISYLHQNWLIAISTPVYLILILIEIIISNYQQKKIYSLKETLINFWLNILNTIIAISVKVSVLLILGWFIQFQIFSFSFFESYTILYWVLLFIGVDLCFYFEHRCEHFSRILWAVHVTHHSSAEYNLTTGFRSSVFRPFVSFWFFIPLVILGARPIDILLMDALCQIYGILVHTQYIKKMPIWFENIFVSPSHHRVHHASNIIYLDKNMGMVFIIWDKLFKTFQPELVNEKIMYGIRNPVTNPHHPIHIIFHEWQNLFKDLTQKNISLKYILKYIFDAPGWSHDGKSKTAKQLRKEINKD